MQTVRMKELQEALVRLEKYPREALDHKTFAPFKQVISVDPQQNPPKSQGTHS